MRRSVRQENVIVLSHFLAMGLAVLIAVVWGGDSWPFLVLFGGFLWVGGLTFTWVLEAIRDLGRRRDGTD